MVKDIIIMVFIEQPLVFINIYLAITQNMLILTPSQCWPALISLHAASCAEMWWGHTHQQGVIICYPLLSPAPQTPSDVL